MATPVGTYYDGSQMKANGEYYDPSVNLGSSAYDYTYSLGDFLSGGMAAGKQAEAQAAMDAKEWARNEYSAQQQRAFEEYMSNTQVQRAMKDLEAAGLNPWLAVQSAGFGSSIPTGAAASSSAGQVSSAESGSRVLAGIGTSALGLAALFKTVAKLVK